MDGLRKLAVAAFEGEKRFSDTVHEFTFIQAQPNNEQRTIIQPRKIPKNEIVSRMAAKPSATSGGSSSPELKLVQIQIADPSPFYIEKQLFLQTFETLQLEPYILHLILLNSYGFHRFPAAPPLTNNQVISSYFVSTIMYMLAWSFNPVTLETKAILMTRTANGMTTFEEVEYYFGNILSVYADHINSPTFLSLVAGTHLVHFLDEYILHQLIGTRELEACTGYGDIVPIESELDVNAITRLSKKTGRILTVLANIHRHLLISDAVISDVSRTLDSLDPKQTVILPVDSQTIHVKRNEPLVNVVSALETQIIWNKSYVAYLLERAKSQTAVVRYLPSQNCFLCLKGTSFKDYAHRTTLRRA